MRILMMIRVLRLADLKFWVVRTAHSFVHALDTSMSKWIMALSGYVLSLQAALAFIFF